MEGIDTEFALVANNGNRLFPYKKRQRSTGRYGYALSKPGEQDRHGGGEYTEDLDVVIKRLVFDGWKVRARTLDSSKSKREGSYGIGKSSIDGYEISKRKLSLVSGADVAPLKILP